MAVGGEGSIDTFVGVDAATEREYCLSPPTARRGDRFGPAGVANSMALKVSGVTKDTPSPAAGELVKDATTGEPTGLLRNAYGVLKGVPVEGDALTPTEKSAAVKKLLVGLPSVTGIVTASLQRSCSKRR